MNQRDLSMVLEIINGVWAIESLSLAIVAAAYLRHEMRARGLRFTKHHHWTVGMRVAAAVGTLSVGSSITRTTVYFWRVNGAGDFSIVQLYTLVTGAAIAAVGYLFAVREISRPLYGPLPWIATMVAIVVAAALMTAVRF